MDLQDWKIIASYSRADALNDGVQVAIPREITKEAGIKYPVYFTQRVYSKYVSVPKGMDYETEDCRLWDILYMFSLKARNSDSALLLFDFVCHLPDKDDWTLFEKVCEKSRLLREVTLKAEIGPHDIDDPSPAITILLPDED